MLFSLIQELRGVIRILCPPVHKKGTHLYITIFGYVNNKIVWYWFVILQCVSSRLSILYGIHGSNKTFISSKRVVHCPMGMYHIRFTKQIRLLTDFPLEQQQYNVDCMDISLVQARRQLSNLAKVKFLSQPLLHASVLIQVTLGSGRLPLGHTIIGCSSRMSLCVSLRIA